MTEETTSPHRAVDGVLWYPRNADEPSTIKVALYDVRAADDLVIGYDYERDSWTIARGADPDTFLALIRSWADLDAEVHETFTAAEAQIVDEILDRVRAEVVGAVMLTHEPRRPGCACGVEFGDSIDARWHLANQVADAAASWAAREALSRAVISSIIVPVQEIRP